MASIPSIDNFNGTLITSSSPEYDEARQLWNAMFDRKPYLIARCASENDVAAVINYACKEHLPLAVKCGGHSMQGLSVCDDGIVIDLSYMNKVYVNTGNKRVRIGGGCLLGDMDSATAEYGLATTAGAISHTGAGGLILGGGYGHLMRKFGLTIDNLISARIVLASGEARTISEDQNADLFWAIRGGSGNFGVITEFELGLHELSTIKVAIAIHRNHAARPVIQHWRDTMKDAPDDLLWGVFFRKSPRFPFLPGEFGDEPLLMSSILWTGDDKTGEEVMSTLLDKIKPEFTMQETIPYVRLQQTFDEIFKKGNRNYCKSGMFNTISDEALDIIVDAGSRIPSWRSQFELFRLGGVIDRIEPDATAYPHRGVGWVYNIISVWEDAADDAINIGWARDVYDAIQPYSTGGAYVNYMGGEETGGANAAYGLGRTMQHLADIKRKYDPENIFRSNINIKPAI